MNLSLPRRRESSNVTGFWIPAFAGMTFLGVAYYLLPMLSMCKGKHIHEPQEVVKFVCIQDRLRTLVNVLV